MVSAVYPPDPAWSLLGEHGLGYAFFVAQDRRIVFFVLALEA
jgi:hypothetical protein